MQVPFRQGIVKSVPNFLQLTGSTVSLVVPQPAYILATIADGTSDYLISESSSVTSAWTGPFVSGTDYWLFWDLHPVSGLKTYGHTLYEPVESAVAPSAPYNDQHWYDSSSHKMKVWNAVANRWVERIRVFAARLSSSSQLISMSINSPSFEGTQVGSYVSTPVSSGYLVLDSEGKALRKGNGKFFTTEDVGVAGVTNSSRVKFSSIVREAESTANMAASTVVAFTDFDTIEPADPLMVSQGKLFGIIEEDVIIGGYVNVVFEGMVSSPSWDWTAQGVNAPLYINEGGVLSTTATAPALDPIAVVSGIHSIQFGVPKVINHTIGGTVVGAMTDVTQGTGKLSVAAANPLDPIVVGDNDPRLTDARLPLSHNHIIAEVTGLQGALDGLAPVLMTEVVNGVGRLSIAAATPSDPIVVGDNDPRLTDNRLPLAHSHNIGDVLNLQTTLDDKVAKAGGTMTGALTLSGDPTLAMHAATKQYVDAAGGGESYHPIVGAKDGFVAGSADVHIANGIQQYGLATKVSVTEVFKTPIFRIDWVIETDPYRTTPNAIGYSLRVRDISDSYGDSAPVAWVSFTDQNGHVGTPFVNPYAYTIMENPVGAGIPIGKHDYIDYNVVNIFQPMSTPPAFLVTLDSAGNITPSSPTGLVVGTLYNIQFRLLGSDFWAPPISTVTISIDGGDAATVADFVNAVNNAVIALDGGSIKCAWSFGGSIVFVNGSDEYTQSASYLDVDMYDPTGPFQAMTAYHAGSFWSRTDNIPATGPQPSDPYATNTDSLVGGLRWYIPLVGTTPLLVVPPPA